MSTATGHILRHDLSLRGPPSRTEQAPQLAHELARSLETEPVASAFLEALAADDDWVVVRRLHWPVPWPSGRSGAEALRRALPELRQALALAEQRGEVLRFPSRVAYLATCLTDLLAGRHDRWYHRAALDEGGQEGSPVASLLRAAADDRDALLGQALASGQLGATLSALPTKDSWELLAERLGPRLPPQILRRLRSDLTPRPPPHGEDEMTRSRPPVSGTSTDPGTRSSAEAAASEPLAELQASLHAGVDELTRAMDQAVTELSTLGEELRADLGNAVQADELEQLRELWEQAVAADPEGPPAESRSTTVLGELLARAVSQARGAASDRTPDQGPPRQATPRSDDDPSPPDEAPPAPRASAPSRRQRPRPASPPTEDGLLSLLRGLLPETPLDETARLALRTAWDDWLREETPGPSWSDPRALTLALGRGLVRTVEALDQAGVSEATAWSRPGQLEALARRHDWLDAEALRRSVQDSAGEDTPRRADDPPARARMTELIEQLLADPELQGQLLIAGSARRAVVLHTALRARAPELARRASEGHVLLEALARWEARQAQTALSTHPKTRTAPEPGAPASQGRAPGRRDHGATLHSDAAGLLLMLRTTRDLRLGPLLEAELGPAAARQVLLRVGSGLAGQPLLGDGGAGPDPAVLLWAHGGARLDPVEDLGAVPSVPRAAARNLVRRLARRRRDLRLDGDTTLQVLGLRGSGRRWAMALDGISHSPVLVAAARDRATLARQVQDWGRRGEELGRQPPVLQPDAHLAEDLGLPDPGGAQPAPPHVAEQAASLLDLVVPTEMPLGTQEVLAAATAACLRAWARWLPGFEGSSAAFLAERFLRRPAQLIQARGELVVRLQPAPLDVVLRRARAFDPLDLGPADPIRRLRFEGAGG